MMRMASSTIDANRDYNLVGQKLKGHCNTVTCVALADYYYTEANQSQLFIASGSMDYTVRLWACQSKSYKAVHVLRGHSDVVWSVAFVDRDDASHTPREVLSGSGDRTILLWDVLAGEKKRVFSGHAGNVTGLHVISESLRYFFSVSSDKTIRLWDIRSKQTTAIALVDSGLECGAIDMHEFSGHIATGHGLNKKKEQEGVNIWTIKTGSSGTARQTARPKDGKKECRRGGSSHGLGEDAFEEYEGFDQEEPEEDEDEEDEDDSDTNYDDASIIKKATLPFKFKDNISSVAFVKDLKKAVLVAASWDGKFGVWGYDNDTDTYNIFYRGADKDNAQPLFSIFARSMVEINMESDLKFVMLQAGRSTEIAECFFQYNSKPIIVNYKGTAEIHGKGNKNYVCAVACDYFNRMYVSGGTDCDVTVVNVENLKGSRYGGSPLWSSYSTYDNYSHPYGQRWPAAHHHHGY